MCKKIFIWLMICCGLSTLSIAQNGPYPNKKNGDPRFFMLQSSDAAGLSKVSDFGVDHSSGIATTNIPVFKVTSGRIKLLVPLIPE